MTLREMMICCETRELTSMITFFKLITAVDFLHSNNILHKFIHPEYNDTKEKIIFQSFIYLFFFQVILLLKMKQLN